MRLVLMILAAVLALAIAAVGAGYLFLKRADLSYETLEATYALPGSQYIDLDNGVRAHFVESGPPQAPVLLLVHGFSASIHTWEPWAQRLSDAYRLVRLDLPGHGLTRAPEGYQATIAGFVDEVERFAAALELETFTIAGSSMGGNVAWEYALAHPERVEGLVLIAASGWPETRAGLDRDPPIFQLLRNPVLGPLMRDLDNTALARQGLRASFANPAMADEAMVRRYVALARAPGHRDILLQLTLGFRQRNYATAERLAPLEGLPVLVLHGAQDNLVPAAHAQQFVQAIPQAELQVWEGVGHIPQEEAAEDSAARLRAFLMNRVHLPTESGVADAPMAPAP